MTKLLMKSCFIFCLYSWTFYGKTMSQVTIIPLNRDHFGKKMIDNIVKILPVNSLKMCVFECLVTSKCLSINYYLNASICELNTEDSGSSPDSLVDFVGQVIYTDIALWPRSIGKQCAEDCPVAQRCTPAPPSYVCLRDECDSPPSVLDATLMSNSTMRRLNDVVTYQCENGLSVRGNPSLTCGERFIWSQVNFRCAMPGSCKELKHCNSSYNTDGEYWIFPAPFNPVEDIKKVKVYCSGMSLSEPKEYITLSGVNDARYDGREAVYYWENGSPPCAIRSYGTVRTTSFQKVRLNPEDMTIINDDFTFSTTTGGASMKYGTGGDCTFAFGCRPRQGYFHIDTTNTGLIVDTTIEWVGNGWGPKLHDFVRSENGKKITIRCGGKCGGCEPERAMNLVINPGEDIAQTSAIMPVCG